MAPKLYIFEASPPCRAVQMLAKHLGIELDVKILGIKTMEHLSPEFIKINPKHTTPVLVEDDGFTLVESQAILIYLYEKYAKDDSLYPKDLRRKARVNQKLFFEADTAFRCLITIIRPFYFKQKTKMTEADLEWVLEVYQLVETDLKDIQWIAGDSPSIADYSLFATMSSFDLFSPINKEKYPKVTAWMERCKTLPGYGANVKGLEVYREIMKTFGIIP